MTIWPERTQRSIVSSFAAAPVGGNRILRSAVPSGQRVLRSVAAPVGAATPTPPLSPRAKENLPSLMLSHQLKKWEEVTVEKPPISRSVCLPLCATYDRWCAVRVPHGGG